MKKTAVILCVILFMVLPVSASETDELYNNAPDALKQAVNDASPEEVKNLLDGKKFFSFITDGLSDSIRDALKTLSTVFAAALLSGLYDSISGKPLSTNRLGEFLTACCVTLAVSVPVISSAREISEGVVQMTDYVKISLPVLTGLMAASGNVSRASVIHFLAYNAAVWIAGMFSGTVVSVTGSFLAVGISARLSNNTGLDRLSDGMKKIAVRLSVLLCLLFSFSASFQTLLAKPADGVLKKTLKTAVGASLPVGGSALSESVETVMSGIGAIKNAGGIFAILSVVYFMALPALKALVNYLTLQLAMVICGCMGAKNAERIIEVMSDAYTILITVCAAVTCVFILCLAAVITEGGA